MNIQFIQSDDNYCHSFIWMGILDSYKNCFPTAEMEFMRPIAYYRLEEQLKLERIRMRTEPI
jgi:hypothetical protein